MIIPLVVFCSAGAGSTRTLSARGLNFKAIFMFFNLFRYGEIYAKP
jgi:hypothetical protein